LLLLAGCGNAAVQQADPGHDTAQVRQAARRVVAPSPPKSAAAPRPATSAIPAVQRVIIAGDSIPEDLGPMVTAAMAGPRFIGHTESHPSTGLVRNDFFDWPAAARRIAAERPTTVILMMGGNDNQPIKPPDGPYADPASLRWTAEYARRAGLVMDALRDNGVARVYWLTLPSTTRSGMNVAVTAMGQALHQAARGRPGVTVYDSDQLLAPIAGTAAAHQADGIHLSIQGSQKIAYVLIQRLRADAAGQ
jgi:hypothetical protein